MSQRLKELARLFLKLGATAFGGPAVHIAMLEDEVVSRRKWMSRQYFLDLVGATNLIPGPNSTEMAMHIGIVRAGWYGLAVAGLCFVLPAVLITGCFAWAYVQWGAIPAIAPLFSGIKPVVIAIIAIAVWKLGRTAVKSKRHAWIGAAVLAVSLYGLNEIAALMIGGLAGMVYLRAGVLLKPRHLRILALMSLPPALRPASVQASAGGLLAGAVTASAVTAASNVSLWALGLFFLKVGAVLYGSGYVLVAFLEGGLVREFGWLSQQQLLDAIAVGQFTPGPLLSTATFIGYVIAGIPGAIIATVAIILPSFLYVAALNPIIPRLRRSVWMSAFLDAVNVSAIALMASVVLKLIPTTVNSWMAGALVIAALLVGVKWNLNAAWLILGGAVLGYFLI